MHTAAAGISSQPKIQNYLYWLQERGLQSAFFTSAPAQLEATPPQAKASQPDSDLGHAEAIKCQACALETCRPGVSWGMGSDQAKVLFIGDHPTREAASIGKPFAGPELNLLSNILKAMNLDKTDWFMMNLIQCPTNQDYVSINESYEACYGFLKQQIARLNPEVIVFLGETAAQTYEGIKSLNLTMGSLQEHESRHFLMTHHPREMIEQPALKRACWQAFQSIMRHLEGSQP
jgi:uracil-DNA glycosylase family 4